MSSGERHVILIDQATRVPAYAPNLFLTTQIRKVGASLAWVSANAYCLAALYRFLDWRRIDIQTRFHAGHYLEEHELDSLRDYFKQNQNTLQTADRQPSKQKGKKGTAPKEWVANETQAKKLRVSAAYLAWLARRCDSDLVNSDKISAMEDQIVARSPSVKNKNKGLEERDLTDEQVDYVLDIIKLDCPRNPFSARVKTRNRLMILLMYEFGIRVGELLNIRISDFDFQNNSLRIVRRADQQDDTRQRQPLVKTEDRPLVLANWLIKEIYDYILNDRASLKLAARCPYLFVTHKSGPTQGQALSISSYNKVWHVLRETSGILFGVTGHRLRHRWNYRYSKMVDDGVLQLNEAEEESSRSFLMGWKPGSGTAKIYNRRHVREKANAASLKLQRQSHRDLRTRVHDDEKS
ncbi:site-specific integrase [Pseudomonas sp. RIT412]|uniref:tyrosine-type recombinase/integrase n=2 Tax=unclassified Pseudomonas TaxID=196821 RepID=UPI001C49BBF7|nr:site-specific integrase [Pseudomonas sp. RIT 412]